MLTTVLSPSEIDFIFIGSSYADNLFKKYNKMPEELTYHALTLDPDDFEQPEDLEQPEILEEPITLNVVEGSKSSTTQKKRPRSGKVS